MEMAHQPVMLDEVKQRLLTDKAGIYIDGTFGRGGHASEILNFLDENGRLIAFDKDQAAIDAAKQKPCFQDSRFQLCHCSFANLESTLAEKGLLGKVTGILLDLGVSSPQLDNAERGFSFLRDGPLDMRMDQSQGQSAAEWIASVDDKTLAGVFKLYGEERHAMRIARAIKQVETPITTTSQLASIVAEANPSHEKHKHPATRVFQAIRIFINNELEDLKQGLVQCLNALAVGGRMVVMSFHSLEDRIVKRFFKLHAKGDTLPGNFPVRDSELKKRLRILGRAYKASAMEVEYNVRARSAVLRVAEKLA